MAEGFEDIEAVSAIDVLTRAGVDVTIAGLNEGPVKGAYGTAIVPHTSIDRIAGTYDCIILPGGRRNAESLAAHPRVIELVRHHNDAGKIVAAICAAPSHVLAEAAGILKDKRATGDPVFNDKLAWGGARITGELVTMDGNIVTGMGPGAALLFALTLAEYLVGKEIPDSLARKWRVDRQAAGVAKTPGATASATA
jgi:4-methyl-5(b-hydroxyethyl)-thiazole monophosphate biosynthesis